MTNFEDFSMLLLVCVIFQTKTVVLRLKTTFGEMIIREVEKLNFEIEMLGLLIFTCQTLPTISNLPNVYLWFFPYPCTYRLPNILSLHWRCFMRLFYLLSGLFGYHGFVLKIHSTIKLFQDNSVLYE